MVQLYAISAGSQILTPPDHTGLRICIRYCRFLIFPTIHAGSGAFWSISYPILTPARAPSMGRLTVDEIWASHLHQLLSQPRSNLQ